MPASRVVMPNGTTKSFREGTPKSVIESAKRDMLAVMQEKSGDHESYRASGRVYLTGWDPDDVDETGSSELPEASRGPGTQQGEGSESSTSGDYGDDEPWNAGSQEPIVPTPVQRAAPPLTAEQLGQILPGAKPAAIAVYLDGMNAAMAGMTNPQRAAFLGQVSVENPRLLPEEDLTYHEAGARANFRNVRNDSNLASFINDHQAFANHAYNGVNGNIPGPDSTDGYDYRGRGLLQITGRDGYRIVGLEDSPEALSTPDVSSQASVDFWNNKGLNDASANVLNRAGFDKITRKVNGNAMKKADERWDGYQRALKVFGVSPQE